MNTSTRALLALLATAALVAALPLAPAQGNADDNQGTVKIHDEPETTPPQRNVPHVSCDFYVEGFNFQDPSGRLVFYSWPPTGDKEVVQPEGDDLTWTGEPENDESGGYHFMKGPYYLDPGHYRLEVYTDDGHPGHNHFAKSKTFWVEPCEDEQAPENPPCPPGVSAVALGNETIKLDWGPVEGAEAYVVYRAVGSESEFEMLAATTETEYFDEDVEAGTTYEYYVTAVDNGQESENCEIVEATAIPFFPTLMVGALALVGSVGLYAVLRRR